MDLELHENIMVAAAALVVSLFGVDDIRSYNVVNHALIVQMWSVRPRPGEFRGRPARQDLSWHRQARDGAGPANGAGHRWLRVVAS